jgi:SAM-dependent methyltransferase
MAVRKRSRDFVTTPPQIFTPAYYARLQEIERDHWWYRGMRAISARWLDAELCAQTGLRVLDIGCGAGYMQRWFQRYAWPQPVVGIDLDRSALSYARYHGGVTARASALGLPFTDCSFDIVHCADVLQHLPVDGGDALALVECHRVLAPGGLLLLRTNATPGLGDIVGDPHHQRYRLPALVGRVAASGFEILRSTHVNVLPSLAATARRVLLRPKVHTESDGTHVPGLPRIPRVSALNWALTREMSMEALLLSLPHATAPFGHSALVLARRREVCAHP